MHLLDAGNSLLLRSRRGRARGVAMHPGSIVVVRKYYMIQSPGAGG